MNNLVGGVILAGGLSRRMGGQEKGMVLLDNKTILSRVIERAKPQTEKLILNANGNSQRFKGYKLTVVKDSISDYPGPLAGILSGMEWMSKNFENAIWLASFPCDAPFIPTNFVEKCLYKIPSNTEIVCAKSVGRTHPVCALWKIKLMDELNTAIEKEGVRKIDNWTKNYNIHFVEFETTTIDPFFNINSPDDLKEAKTIINN